MIPVASGSQLTKIDKGFRELVKLGLVEDKPYKVFGAQATGCSPVSAAFKDGHDVVRPVKPDTIAKSLAIGNPADGTYVLDVCRRTGGAVEDVTDDEVRDGIRAAGPDRGHLRRDRRRRDGRRCCKKLIETGQLDPDAETVIINTGDGLKTLDASPTGSVRGDHRAVVRRLRRRRHRAESRTDPTRSSTDERHRPDPHHPAHLHRRRVRGDRARAPTLAERARLARRRATPASRAGSSTTRASCAASSTSTSATTTSASSTACDTPTPDGAQVSIIPAVAGG